MNLNIKVKDKIFNKLLTAKFKDHKNSGSAKILITDDLSIKSDKKNIIFISKDKCENKGYLKTFIYQSPETINDIYNFYKQLEINSNTKVIISDEDKKRAKKIQNILQSHLYQVFTVHNSIETLEVYEQQKDINIIITNYNPSLLNGCELTKIIRRGIPLEKLGIIAITNKINLDKFLELEINNFIYEEFEEKELLFKTNTLARNLYTVKEIENSANYDFLTGIPNRKLFFETAPKIVKKSKNIALAMIDIDNFKKINDTYGHSTGDEVIKALANNIKQSIKGKDIVARLGGEEFVLLLQDIKTLDAINFVNQICKDISRLKVNDINFTISCGLVTKRLDLLDEMIAQADRLLYHSKENGKNRVTSDMNLFVL